MSTSQSPRRKLKAEASKMARILKDVAAGKSVVEDVGGKLAASLARGTAKVAIMMDDKIIAIEMEWDAVRATGQIALAEVIFKKMRGATEH